MKGFVDSELEVLLIKTWKLVHHRCPDHRLNNANERYRHSRMDKNSRVMVFMVAMAMQWKRQLRCKTSMLRFSPQYQSPVTYVQFGAATDQGLNLVFQFPQTTGSVNGQ